MIKTVGDELRSLRLDRGLTQYEVSERVGANKNFVCEMELNQSVLTIKNLHRVYLFLGYIPTTLKIDERSLKERFLAHRIRYGFTYKVLAHKIELDKSTLIRFGKGRKVKEETIQIIEKYLSERDCKKNS